MILVPGRKRFITDDTALKISNVVKSTVKPSAKEVPVLDDLRIASEFFDHSLTLINPHRALLVGVFCDATLSHIIEKVRTLDLDIVQLHGTEPLEWARLIPVPVFRRFSPSEVGLGSRGYHELPLLDAGAGGSGKQLDISAIQQMCAADSGVRFILAGGLDPSNVSGVLEALGDNRKRVMAVDVSSGIESDGRQDHDKIRAFVKAAKEADA